MHTKLPQGFTGNPILATETEHGTLQPLGDSPFEQAMKAYSRGARKFRAALTELAKQPQESGLAGLAGDRREEDLG